MINWATGGDQYSPGILSPTPDAIDYVLQQATGGVGREVSKLAQLAQTSVTGEDFPFYKMPMVGRFAGSATGPTSIRDDFYEHIKQVNIAADGLKGRLHNPDDRADAPAYAREHPEARLLHMSNQIQDRLSALQKQRKALLAHGGSREQVALKEQQITALMSRFNQRVESVMDGPEPSR